MIAARTDQCSYILNTALSTDIIFAAPQTVFQDKSHFDFAFFQEMGVNLLWPEVICAALLF
jgi:hypothetical protein